MERKGNRGGNLRAQYSAEAIRDPAKRLRNRGARGGSELEDFFMDDPRGINQSVSIRGGRRRQIYGGRGRPFETLPRGSKA